MSAAVDHVYIVHADPRGDHLTSIMAQLDGSDLRYTPRFHIPARDGASEDLSAYLTEAAQADLAAVRAARQKQFVRQVSPKAVGDYMSHIDVWQLIASLPDKGAHVLVVADDTVLPPDTNARLQSAWAGVRAAKGHHRPFVLFWNGGEFVVDAATGVVQASRALQHDLVGPPHLATGPWWASLTYSLTPKTAETLLHSSSGLLPIEWTLEGALQQLATRRGVDIYLSPRLPHANKDPAAMTMRFLAASPTMFRRADKQDMVPTSGGGGGPVDTTVLAVVTPTVFLVVVLVIIACLLVMTK
jgi:hypothetical protein